ncbi:MAG: alpha/beta fold hydrolase [Planctomycetota bacterium]
MASEKKRRRPIRRLIIFLIINSAFTLVLALAAFVYGWTMFARSLPDLQGWHLEAPESEFEAEDAEAGYTFDDYLVQEDVIFDELDDLIDSEWASIEQSRYSRFHRGSLTDPDTVSDRNWNRSLKLEAADPVGGAVLIHGLSDSPYSLRMVGEVLHAEGWTVYFLRVPGHGTSPRALAQVSWRDWAAAVRVAAHSLHSSLPDDAPMVLFGFSNGGALAMQYATAAVTDDDIPTADGVVLFSPMIGITAMAQITEAYSIIGRISGLEKVAWSRVTLECDPFKYSSWPMNASVQAWRMTQNLESLMVGLERAGRLGELPPVLTFQSAVDATVVVPRLVDRVYDRMQTSASELVLFDVNRLGVAAGLIKPTYAADYVASLESETAPYTLSLVTNRDAASDALIEKRRVGTEITTTDLGLDWPDDIFSLSHGAIPIPEDDPVLGNAQATKDTALPLGSLHMRGETGVLVISESLLMRQRYNPFDDYMQTRMLEWLQSVTGSRTP